MIQELRRRFVHATTSRVALRTSASRAALAFAARRDARAHPARAVRAAEPAFLPHLRRGRAVAARREAHRDHRALRPQARCASRRDAGPRGAATRHPRRATLTDPSSLLPPRLARAEVDGNKHMGLKIDRAKCVQSADAPGTLSSRSTPSASPRVAILGFEARASRPLPTRPPPRLSAHAAPRPSTDARARPPLALARRYWLSVGAQPSDTVARLFGQAGIIPMPPRKLRDGAKPPGGGAKARGFAASATPP